MDTCVNSLRSQWLVYEDVTFFFARKIGRRTLGHANSGRAEFAQRSHLPPPEGLAPLGIMGPLKPLINDSNSTLMGSGKRGLNWTGVMSRGVSLSVGSRKKFKSRIEGFE